MGAKPSRSQRRNQLVAQQRRNNQAGGRALGLHVQNRVPTVEAALDRRRKQSHRCEREGAKAAGYGELLAHGPEFLRRE